MIICSKMGKKKRERRPKKKGCIIMQLYNLIILYMMETNIIYVIMIESWCIEGINWLLKGNLEKLYNFSHKKGDLEHEI